MLRSFFNKSIVLIAFALLIKMVFVLYITHQATGQEVLNEKILSRFILKTSDYSYFIQPVENYFKDNAGVVYLSKTKEPFAGRMPGYWFPYLLIRSVFSHANALIVLILIQLLLSAISVFYLAKAALNMFNDKRAFYFVYFLFLFCPYILPFDLSTQTESFAVSASVFHFYFLSRYFYGDKKKTDLFCAGLFLAWVIFLRPFTGLAIVFVPCFLLFYLIRQKQSWRMIVIELCVVCAGFGLLESIWITRNYVQLKKIIPLETSLEDSYGKLYAKPWVKIRQMIVAFGEDAAYFEPGTLSAWFKKKPDSTKVDDYSYKADQFAGVSFTKDSIRDLKHKYLSYMKEQDPAKEKLLYDQCVYLASRYQEQYTSSHKLKVYLVYPVKRFCKFIFNSGSSYLPLPPFSTMLWHQKVVKLFSSLMYYLIIVFGFIGMAISFMKKERKPLEMLMFVHILVLVLLVVVFIDIQENRYLMTVFPAFVLFACNTFLWIEKKRRSSRLDKSIVSLNNKS